MRCECECGNLKQAMSHLIEDCLSHFSEGAGFSINKLEARAGMASWHENWLISKKVYIYPYTTYNSYTHV